MNARLAAVLSLIPERFVRTHAGTPFAMSEAATCAHPERMTMLSERLHWLSPLDRLSKDEQRALGLLAPNGRPPAIAEADEMGIDEEAIGEEAIDELDEDAAMAPELAESERQGSAGTLVAP
jgi:hypothetical protein